MNSLIAAACMYRYVLITCVIHKRCALLPSVYCWLLHVCTDIRVWINHTCDIWIKTWYMWYTPVSVSQKFLNFSTCMHARTRAHAHIYTHSFILYTYKYTTCTYTFSSGVYTRISRKGVILMHTLHTENAQHDFSYFLVSLTLLWFFPPAT